MRDFLNDAGHGSLEMAAVARSFEHQGNADQPRLLRQVQTP
jgi:hypothetical protein